jgi:hypothetical protein
VKVKVSPMPMLAGRQPVKVTVLELRGSVAVPVA